MLRLFLQLTIFKLQRNFKTELNKFPQSFIYEKKDSHRNHNVYSKLTTDFFFLFSENESHSVLTMIEFQN